VSEFDASAALAEIAALDAALAEPNTVQLLALLDAPKSMARLTQANLAAFELHLSSLADQEFVERLLRDPSKPANRQYVEATQHLAANYVLSAVPLLEHLRHHVTTNYPDTESRTRVQHQLGLEMGVEAYPGHVIVIRLRHMIAHRHLPTVRIVAGGEDGVFATPIIDRREVLEDTRCPRDVRRMLLELPTDELSLDHLILDDGRYVLEFAQWFFGIQALHHINELTPIARLMRRREQLVAETLA
jgi:hypothetical protein